MAVECRNPCGATSWTPARAAAADGVPTVELPDADAALALLDSPDCPLRDADAVLVKGSHDSGAWRIADRLKEGLKEMDAR